MLSYSQLSPGQKKWVLMVNVFYPEITDTITFEQVNEFHAKFMELRETDTKYKVGLPNWLLRANRIGKGMYFFPGEHSTPPDNDIKVDEPDALNDKYLEHLMKFGVGVNI